jgi:hypothetical protein
VATKVTRAIAEPPVGSLDVRDLEISSAGNMLEVLAYPVRVVSQNDEKMPYAQCFAESRERAFGQ